MEVMKAFTCIGKGHGAPCLPATKEDWEKMRREPWLSEMCARIEKGDEALKHRLPVWTPHCAEFKDNHRAIADAVKPLNRLMLDFDEKGHTSDIMSQLKEKSDALKAAGVMVLLIEDSVRRGTHVLVELPEGMTAEEAQTLMKETTGFTPDAAVKDVSRCIYMVTEEHTKYVSDELFEIKMAPSNSPKVESRKAKVSTPSTAEDATEAPTAASLAAFDLCAEQAGLKPGGMDVWGEHNWHTNLMAVLSVGVAKLMSRQQLKAVVAERLPNYSQTKDCQTLIDYFYEKYDADKGFMNTSLREINAKAQKKVEDVEPLPIEVESEEVCLPKMPQGVKDSIDAVGPQLAMPVVTAICPCIGALATGVVLDVHGRKRGLNLIAYIAGDFASGKGDIDPVVDAWMSEVAAVDKMYLQQEEEFRTKKQAAKNKKEQPEEPKLPIRYVTLNTTVAKLAERLANTEGKHAYSFTPEADTVAQKLKTAISDFSVMLRESYDGSKFDREAKSLEAVNVHIEHLLWNVTMCGTPDALYRVVRNYTDGFQSRIAVARTPDNTFAPLEDKPHVLTDRQRERIQQVAHLLPLMHGEVVLPKLEAKGREWLEQIRLETMKNDDRTKARQRFRVCVTAQRMTCCIMLCKVCEMLIKKYGLNGAESRLKQHPDLWKEMLLKTQTPQMMDIYGIIADSLLENALHFFRDRIENAFNSREYAGSNERLRNGKNDSIYERLDVQFSIDQAMQQCVAVKGAGVTRNSVRQMLKNWKRQGLVMAAEHGQYRKMLEKVS